jgi:hypothetical protein
VSPSHAAREQLGQALPVAKAANDCFKEAVTVGHGDEDFSAVHETTLTSTHPAGTSQAAAGHLHPAVVQVHV